MSATNLEQIAELIEQLSEADQQRLVKRLAQRLRHATEQGKMTAMRAAAADPLFLADLNEVAEDFRYADLDDHAA